MEVRDRSIQEGVEALARTGAKPSVLRHKDPTASVVSFFKGDSLCLLQADKSGGFVAMDVDSYNFKAGQAVNKNIVKKKAS